MIDNSKIYSGRLILTWMIYCAIPFMTALAQSKTEVRESLAQSDEVALLLKKRCLSCHSDSKKEGSYSISSFAKMRIAGDSDKGPIIQGKPEESELYLRLISTNSDERMPAESSPLSAENIALIKAWILAGAKVPESNESKSMASWISERKSVTTPKHYPSVLPITAIGIRPQSDSIFVSGYGEVIERKLPGGEELKRIEVSGEQIADIEVTTDGNFLGVSSGRPGVHGEVQIWKINGGASPVLYWSDSSSDVSADIAFSPNGKRLAIGRADGTLRLVDLELLESKLITPHADAILAVAWSSSGHHFITGSRDRTAKIFDARKMELIANYDRHARAVGGVAYHADNPLSFDETGHLRMWQGDDNDKTVAERDNLARFLEHLVVDGEKIYLADGPDIRSFQVERKTIEDGKKDDGEPKTKKVTQLKEQDRLASGGRDWILSIATSPEMIAAGTESGEVVLWKKDGSKSRVKFLMKP